MVSRVNRSLLMSALDSYLGVVLQLASTVIISRLLTPDQIGVFAIAAVFAALASMFRDFGVAEYMIQERELTREKIAAAMSLNIMLSWAMALAMFAGSFAAEGFYGESGIGAVMRVLALNFVLIPFGAIGMAYHRRELEFRPILVSNAAGHVVGFVASVWLAVQGHGYMSLAWSSLLSVCTVVTCSILFRPPGFPSWPGLKGIGEVFHFGKFASGIYIFSQLGKGAPEMMIGRVGSMADVAVYSRASGIVELFHRAAIRPVTRVCMPYFAQHDRSGGSALDAYAKSVLFLTAVGWPFLGFMALEAEAAVRLMYGWQWDAAIPLARILCLACAVELVHLLAREVLLAMGQAERASRLQIGLLVLQVTGISAVIWFGLHGAAWGVAAAAVLGAALSQWHLRRGLSLTLRQIAGACLPSAMLTLLTLAPLLVWRWQRGAIAAADGPWYALIGGLLTAAAWLLALRLLRHPLYQHLAQTAAPLWQRIRGGSFAPRAGGKHGN